MYRIYYFYLFVCIFYFNVLLRRNIRSFFLKVKVKGGLRMCYDYDLEFIGKG